MDTIQIIMYFSTAIVTFISGLLIKKINLYESKYIPIQNVIIGVLSGLIAFGYGLFDNIFVAIISCFSASMFAGGVYDASKTKFGGDEIENK